MAKFKTKGLNGDNARKHAAGKESLGVANGHRERLSNSEIASQPIKKRKISAQQSSDVAVARAEDPDQTTQSEEEGGKALNTARQRFRNKEKVLLLTSRGVPPRFRHLALDFASLLPHSKREAKLDTKSQRNVINEVADLRGCSNVLFFEARKHKDFYLWIAKPPQGPSVKFLCTNVHTMNELKLSGNHLKGSRPVLCFDEAFDEQPHWQLMKEMLTHIFVTPQNHPKSKPFVDHVINFSIADGRIWLRNYQLVNGLDKKKRLSLESLVETGPRLTLNPIHILSGSFSGPKLFTNTNYVSPNVIRTLAKRQKAGKYQTKIATREKRKLHAQENPLPISELADVFK